jgi:hypothetical protein
VLDYVQTMGPVDCPEGTPVGDQCPAYWYMYGEQLGIQFDGGVPADLAVAPPPAHDSGCGLGGAGAALGPPALLGLMLAAAAAWMRRRRGQRNRNQDGSPGRG